MQYEENYKQLLMKSRVYKDLILYINTKSRGSIFMHTCEYRNGVVYIIMRIYDLVLICRDKELLSIGNYTSYIELRTHCI